MEAAGNGGGEDWGEGEGVEKRDYGEGGERVRGDVGSGGYCVCVWCISVDVWDKNMILLG